MTTLFLIWLIGCLIFLVVDIKINGAPSPMFLFWPIILVVAIVGTIIIVTLYDWDIEI